MPSITLAVAQGVITQVKKTDPSQKQIAIRRHSPDLHIGSASLQNMLLVKIGGVIELMVGDNGAIWAVHQLSGVQADDFNDLYSLLERRPDDEITFQW